MSHHVGGRTVDRAFGVWCRVCLFATTYSAIMAPPSKVTTWDPVMIISQERRPVPLSPLNPRPNPLPFLSFQIVAFQSLHYLTLALLVPPLLSLFAEPGSLEYEGGAFNVGTLKGPLYSLLRESDDRYTQACSWTGARWLEDQPSGGCTVKNVGLPSPARGVMAARLLKVPGTWAQTAAAITCGAGSLHRVGSWHQRRSGSHALTSD